jgi:predicted secreted hydrolase
MNKFFLLLGVLSLLTPLLIKADSFETVVPGKTFTFPRDHGSHPEFETEWWYYTGHLSTVSGTTFGFQLTFFRVGVDPFRESESNWHVPSLHLAHFAISDDANKRFFHTERLRRGNFNTAGASRDSLKVWNGDWNTRMDGNTLYISAKTEEVELELNLNPQKPVIFQGEDGYSKKGKEKGEASYYYSYTRLEGEGHLKIGTDSHPISKASAWLDREFTSSKLAQATEGWDWFAIQLDSREDIMVYQLRDKEGNPNEFSSGSFITPSGEKTHLADKDFTIEVLSYWKSPQTNIRYPSEWKISLPSKNREYRIKPTFNSQELITEKSTGVTYWEGRSQVFEGTTLVGNAYVELVGYQ